MERKKEESYETVDDAGKIRVKLDIFLKGAVQRLMGIALDNGRLAINTDRQFTQFEKTVKDEFYKFSDNSVKYLTSCGVIQNVDRSKDEKSQ